MAVSVTQSEPLTTPRWLHFWAMFTVCATFAGLLAGSLVTTLRVGMADPVWPTVPWYLLVFNWQEPRPGFIIEHSHRAAMYVVGLSTILLAVGLWRCEPRRWLRWLGMAALGGVIVQGLLGGLRVLLDRRFGTDLALLHGCLAQLVAATLVSIACVTAPAWSRPRLKQEDTKSAARLRNAALASAVLIYGQVVFGAVLRHTYSPFGQRGHLLLAFAIVAAVVWLLKETREHMWQERGLVVAATLLAVLVGVQLLMGVEAWMLRFEASTPARQMWTRTTHVMLGYMIFATAVVTALQTFRPRVAEPRLALHPLEGAA